MSVICGSVSWITCRLPSVRLSLCYQVRNFPRGRRPSVNDGLLEPLDVVNKTGKRSSDFEAVQDFEAVEDWFDDQLRNNNLMGTIQRDYEKHRQYVAYKTIERKYFKPPKEQNLLTWDAKEQIRYLNAEYPEEWTVDRLAKSFPCSREGIISVLKSKYKPKSLHELQKHDRRVRSRWLALKNGVDSQGPIALRYEQLSDNGKMNLLLNAAGIKHLPQPKVFLPQTAESKMPAKAGPFESIVKDYVEKKNKKQAKERGSIAGNQSIDNDEKLLQSIVNLKDNEKLKRDSRKHSQSLQKTMPHNETIMLNASEDFRDDEEIYDKRYKIAQPQTHRHFRREENEFRNDGWFSFERENSEQMFLKTGEKQPGGGQLNLHGSKSLENDSEVVSVVKRRRGRGSRKVTASAGVELPDVYDTFSPGIDNVDSVMFDGGVSPYRKKKSERKLTLPSEHDTQDVNLNRDLSLQMAGTKILKRKS